MRILFSSNAMWSKTGYGVQFGHLAPQFQALGHEIAQFAWYGLSGGMMQIGDIPIFPAGYDIYGNDVSPSYAAYWKADLVITLIDLWVLDPNLGKRTSEQCGQWTPWLAWFPIDHAPPSPLIQSILPSVDYPVQYSRFGLEAVAAAGGPPCRFVPHGCDTAVFTPTPEGLSPRTARTAARERLGFPPDAYICAMVAANKGYPPRKAFPEQLQAFARFQRRHPEALLYLHSQQGAAMGGVNFAALCQSLDIPLDAVRFVDQFQQHIGIPETSLADVYRAADVLLSASYGEGFCVPLVEAQACGTPVVTTAGTSMTELTHNGVSVPSRQKWWMQLGGDQYGWQDTPDVAGIDEALESLYGRPPSVVEDDAARGVTWVRQHYDWQVVVRDYWAPLLTEIEHDIAVRRAGAPPVPEAPPAEGEAA